MPLTPSENEEEHFARLEFEKKKKLAAERAAALASEERTKRKDQHWMKCPKCGDDLTTVKLRGVAVDTCPSCSGMWLDAGELNQLASNDEGGFLRSLKGVFRS